MTYEQFWKPLTAIYNTGEAKAVARMVLEVGFDLTIAEVLCGKVSQLSTTEQALLQQMQHRLLLGEPVQYVLGLADFGPRQFAVNQDVLIPRPETYELCQWCLPPTPSSWQGTILDIGTGSGCIACTLAAELPGAKVTAWDISAKALSIARQNAKRTGVHVSFEQRDILHQPHNEVARWDIIVSNPPYICKHESSDMHPRVLDYEPETALFVPDNDPMMFYLPISKYAQSALRPGGQLFFEVNPLYKESIEDILLGLGFDDILLREDQFGKPRFLRATRNYL